MLQGDQAMKHEGGTAVKAQGTTHPHGTPGLTVDADNVRGAAQVGLGMGRHVQQGQTMAVHRIRVLQLGTQAYHHRLPGALPLCHTGQAPQPTSNLAMSAPSTDPFPSRSPVQLLPPPMLAVIT